jgi:succinyl-CoA synthetase alpha subunit
MIPRAEHRVLVQGITGKQGSFWTEKMLAYGTRIVGGVNPKKAGERHVGVPVFASAAAAMREAPYDIAVMFIPPGLAKEAALDAIGAGAKLLVVLTEHIPLQDVLAIHAAAARAGTRIFGPNTAGLVTPGECFIGIMPAFIDTIFRPGRVGIISRSGSLGTLVSLEVARAGFGQSAFLGIGGDPLIGTTSRDALRLLDEDERTDAVALIGEIGGAMEEEAAEYAKGMKKPVVAFIAGAASPPGRRMGHAGAIVMGDRGSHQSKVSALRDAGVAVAATPFEVGAALKRVLAG